MGGHGALDTGGRDAEFNEKSGREFSAVVGATDNFENYDTDYQNGVDSRLDCAWNRVKGYALYATVAFVLGPKKSDLE